MTSENSKDEKLKKCEKLLSLRSAPLASFEDLPTDEQNSSSSSSSPNDDANDNVIKKQEKQPCITVLITDHEEQTKPYEPLSPTSVMSIETTPNQLLTPAEKATQRKGSWTDIFFGRKSPLPYDKPKERKFSLFSFKFSSKDENKKDQEMPMEVIEKRDKREPSPPVIFDCGVQITSENLEDLCISSTTSYDDTVVYVHSPIYNRDDSTLPIIANYNDEPNDECDSLCSCQDDDHHSDKNVNIIDSTSECSECESRHTCCDSYDNYESTDVDMIADHEDNDDQQQKSDYDSNELEMLVQNDELDLIRKFCHLDVQNRKNETKNKINHDSLRNKENNYRSTTLPIERPHSIVPVTNLEKFEAFIQKYSLQTEDKNSKENDNNKLKIILPINTHKSSRSHINRKSNPFIWLQFCEQGLKSPKIFRKRAKSCFPNLISSQFLFDKSDLFINTDNNTNNNNHKDNNDDDDDDMKSPGNLTPITPLKNIDFDNDDDDDIYTSHMIIKKHQMQNQSSIECQQCCCLSVTLATNSNPISSLTTCSEITSEDESVTRLSKSQKEDEPLLLASSIACNCQCHHSIIKQIDQISSSPLIKKDFENCINEEIHSGKEICMISSPSSSTTATLSSSTTPSSSSSISVTSPCSSTSS